ncbi:uncharacterized protein Hap1MRO34_005599 isoform 1-T5 [Clarias gariepinus]|uniref:uncharacterized protein si:dkey-92i15.4 n=1 Tax=Clarias gariepinus TaxID=13013 RepID=UPI00234DE2E6|nr:uncharacterized protein si:dkey-92i15.4 [Clarias gariepinus]XP_053350126.1 uncharacterized protein si:dkey-92i15.4 [Clarias gariepinus]XP_053350127.1 uncharacterized protein si:dkey-92i15.4 [Clarias gariepinus]XP_053350128.1 uncharacterized protein si:dkey-92i15.4 [Clarias gariepinus]XP_053350129.1 uncharacterized protein si:dkey-92i15.4 [Clarias gariepinus]
MNISAGSTHVPEHSVCQSEAVLRAGNGESSQYPEEQNQRHPQPAVRFKVRSAKEREQALTKASSFKFEAFEKNTRGIRENNKEIPGDQKISPPSPDTNVIDKPKPRALSQLSVTKKSGLSISSEASSSTQKKPDSVESPTTKARGRTDSKQSYLSNRSKSLDWRGSNVQTDVFRNSKEPEERSTRRSESLERKDTANSNELIRPLKKVSLQIQPFKGSTALSVSSPVRTVALAPFVPSRIKSYKPQEKTGEIKNPWHSGNSGTKPDQAEHHPTKGSEITGNHTVTSSSSHNVFKNNTEPNSGASLGIISPAPFISSHGADLNSNCHKPTNSLLEGGSSFSSLSKVKPVSYKPEKFSAFPKAQFKKEEMNFTALADTSSVLPDGNDNLTTISKRSTEKPISQDSTSVVTNSSTHDEKRLNGNFIGLGTQSLGRTRNRHFTAPVSYSAHGPSNSNSLQKICKKEIEREVEITTSNSNQTKDMENIPGKQPHSLQEVVIPQNKPQSPQSMAVDGVKHLQEHGSGLEFGSLGNLNKKAEVLLEKGPKPSGNSVRNKIHKFEALALKGQSPSWTQHPRRAMSVPEQTKAMASVNKTYSDRSLGVRLGEWNRENPFSKSEVSNEAGSGHDQTGPGKITKQDIEASPVQSQIRRSISLKVEQTWKRLDAVPSDQKTEGKFTKMNKYADEPDFSKGSNPKSYQKLNNVDLTEEKVKNYLSPTMFDKSQKSSGITNVSQSDLSLKSETKFATSTKDKPSLKESTHGSPHVDPSTTTKSKLLTGNSTHSKSPSNLLSDSEVIPSIQGFSSTSGDFINNYNTIKDEKVAEKVLRWIMDKGVDDENDYDDDEDEGTEQGYDSDSGESSVTITSNVSSRSFSMSLVELCSLGGLDIPPSDGSGSMDDENWMSKRTVSMSSDVSALSSVTLLGMDELECLLNDVKGLEDDTLENYEDVHVVVLHKEAGNSLGFTVAGGVDQNKPVTVHKILRNGIAAQEGTIHLGDQVLSINGNALQNSTHKEVFNTMKKARGRAMAVVVIRRGDVTETSYSLKDSPQKEAGTPGRIMQVTLNKSSSDLGFSLEGGVGSSLGDKPLTVQRLFQGGPVGKVFPGDELLEVEGQSLQGLRRLEVWNLIKRLPPGPVEVLLQRP